MLCDEIALANPDDYPGTEAMEDGGIPVYNSCRSDLRGCYGYPVLKFCKVYLFPMHGGSVDDGEHSGIVSKYGLSFMNVA
jgi:hypothetical protein